MESFLASIIKDRRPSLDVACHTMEYSYQQGDCDHDVASDCHLVDPPGAGTKQQALVNCDVMEHRRLLIDLDPHDPQPIRTILASLDLPPDVTGAASVLVDGKIVSDRDVKWLRDREGKVVPVRVQCGRLLGGMQRRSERIAAAASKTKKTAAVPREDKSVIDMTAGTTEEAVNSTAGRKRKAGSAPTTASFHTITSATTTTAVVSPAPATSALVVAASTAHSENSATERSKRRPSARGSKAPEPQQDFNDERLSLEGASLAMDAEQHAPDLSAKVPQPIAGTTTAAGAAAAAGPAVSIGNGDDDDAAREAREQRLMRTDLVRRLAEELHRSDEDSMRVVRKAIRDAEHLMEDRKASWKHDLVSVQLDRAALALLAASQGHVSHELIKALIADGRAWQALHDDWGTLLEQRANLQYFVDYLGTPPTATTEAALTDLLKTEYKLPFGCAVEVARVARVYASHQAIGTSASAAPLPTDPRWLLLQSGGPLGSVLQWLGLDVAASLMEILQALHMTDDPVCHNKWIPDMPMLPSRPRAKAPDLELDDYFLPDTNLAKDIWDKLERIQGVVVTGVSGAGKTKALLATAAEHYCLLFDFSAARGGSMPRNNQRDCQSFVRQCAELHSHANIRTDDQQHQWEEKIFPLLFACLVLARGLCLLRFLSTHPKPTPILWRNLQLNGVPDVSLRLLLILATFAASGSYSALHRCYTALIGALEGRNAQFYVSVDEAQELNEELVRCFGRVLTTATTPGKERTAPMRAQTRRPTVVSLILRSTVSFQFRVVFAGTRLRLIDGVDDLASCFAKLGRAPTQSEFVVVVGNVLDAADVFELCSHYFGPMGGECESYLSARCDMLRGRARIAAHYIGIVLRKQTRITRELLESCYQEHVALLLDDKSPESITSHISSLLNENPAKQYPVFVRGGVTLVELLERAAIQYQMKGCAVRMKLEDDLVERALLIVKRVDDKHVHYEFGEPLVLEALAKREEFTMLHSTARYLESVIATYGSQVQFKGALLERLIVSLLLQLSRKQQQLETIPLFRALPLALRSLIPARDSKSVTCSAAEFAACLKAGDVVQPSTMTGVDVAVLVAGSTLLMFGARLYSEALPCVEALQNLRTTDIDQQFCKHDGTRLGFPWVQRAMKSLARLLKSVTTVVRICICLPGIAGVVPPDLAASRYMKVGQRDEYIFVVTRKNLPLLFSEKKVLDAIDRALE